MNGLFDGMFSFVAAMGCFILLLLFVLLKLIGVLVVSWWWVMLPISLVVLFVIICAQPGAP